MKKSIFAIIIFATTLLFTTNNASAQKFSSLDKSPADISLFSMRAGDKLIKIIYSRPQLRGRTLESLAPKGKIWRTGANEATEITFYKDVVFGGDRVKAGTYSLFTIPGDKQWTIILNDATDVWGAYSYNKKQDVARIKAKVSKSETPIEAFSITIQKWEKGAKIYMGWENTIVSIPVK